MSDPFDDRIADALHAEATLAPDTSAAHAEFLQRRRRHQQRLVTASAVFGAILITAAVLALANHSKPKATPVAATGRTTEPQPLEGSPAPSPDDGGGTTTSTAPGPAPSVIGGSGTVSGTAVTTHPAPAPSATSTSAPRTTVPPGPGPHTVVVTNADDQKNYTLHRGDRLVVELQSDGNIWTEPAASDDAVLHRTSGSANQDGSANATFAATADGSADVTSSGRSIPPPCAPRCLMPDHIVEFKVNVTVVG